VNDPRVHAVAAVLREVFGPSPIMEPLGYDAVVIAESCLRAADMAAAETSLARRDK
jgi:hypothetical protein